MRPNSEAAGNLSEYPCDVEMTGRWGGVAKEVSSIFSVPGRETRSCICGRAAAGIQVVAADSTAGSSTTRTFTSELLCPSRETAEHRRSSAAR